MFKSIKNLVLILILVCLSVIIYADLKDYICIIKPVYHEKTRDTFKSLAKYFEESGDNKIAGYFNALAEEHGHGTGWVFVDGEGENYIITNRHVVNQAEKVNLYFEDPGGKQKSYNNCPILFIDNRMDLAVIRFPDEQNEFKTGLELDTEKKKELDEVISAGFPGFGMTPLWQVAKGDITNAHARIDDNYDYMIQHSAPIDPGNSGGPLLVRTKDNDLGFKVVGVNTWKAMGRESTNFAIPSLHVLELLQRAKESAKLGKDVELKRKELIKNCKILMSELNSEHPVMATINKYVSYAYVGEKGWDAFSTLVKTLPEEDKNELLGYFFEDPVEAMRSSIYLLFWFDVMKDDEYVEFKEINFADDEELERRDKIRTNFVVGTERKEIIWSLEYGQWKISNLELRLDLASKGTKKDDKGKKEKGETGVVVKKGGFADDFDGKIDDRWYWVNEKPQKWNLTRKSSCLAVNVERSTNILLTDTSEKNFLIDVKLEIKPFDRDNSAGIVVFLDNENRIDFVIANDWHRGKMVIFTGKTAKKKGYSGSTIYLRLVKKGDTFTASFSIDGENFKEVGELVQSASENLKIGLFVDGPPSTSVAYFDYFRFSPIAE
jgi:regulation of enolase protein 1 (concanavalin A-like superfamily)